MRLALAALLAGLLGAAAGAGGLRRPGAEVTGTPPAGPNPAPDFLTDSLLQNRGELSDRQRRRQERRASETERLLAEVRNSTDPHWADKVPQLPPTSTIFPDELFPTRPATPPDFRAPLAQ